jgi:outer membrane protein assembly factor BamC
MLKFRFGLIVGVAAGVVFAGSGCSTVENMFQGDKVDYKSATKAPSIEVPPDLTQLARDNRFVVPGASGSVSASSFGQGVKTGGVGVLAPVEGMRIERLGAQRYLVVNRKPEELWGPVREFWQSSGFLLSSESADAGVMETDWAENRAKLPQDFIRNTIGKVLDGLYSTGERDKFRTRFERTASGTEVYVSHRGMIEVLQGNQKDSTTWTQRPADPELEAEFLQRLLVRLGQSSEAAKQQVASTAAGAVPAAAPQAKMVTVSGQEAVEISESFERAWRRVGVALDRSGFTVEDRDRAKGVYFVRYVDPSVVKSDERGFFSKLFGGDQKIDPTRYQVEVKSTGNVTNVTVAANAAGKPDAQAKILSLLADSLK